MAVRLTTVSLDCRDADVLADFYSRLLGWDIAARDTADDRAGGTRWVLLANPEGGVGIACQGESWYEPPTWPEQPTRLTKMMHFEVAVDDVDAAVAHALAAGAQIAPHQPTDRDPAELRVMIDPAGHPFCLYASSSDEPVSG